MIVTITLTPAAREAAEQASIMRGLTVPSPFLGPMFEDAAGCDSRGGFVVVSAKSGATYFYNVDTVARIKIEYA